MDKLQLPTSKKPYKRKMTEKRRDQNRIAQKMYRIKRKERLELLEQQISAINKDMTPDHGNLVQTPLATVTRPEQAHSDLGDKPTVTTERRTTLPSTSSTLNHLQRLLEVDDAGSIELLEFALREKPDIKTIVLAGLQALKSASTPGVDPQSSQNQDAPQSPASSNVIGNTQWTIPIHTPMLPDLFGNNIFLRHQPILDVFRHNSQKIGVPPEQLPLSTAQSPWYSPFSSLPTSLVPLECVPPDLVPTPAQRRLPHHPFFDLIPFPWLRERAIVLNAMDPPGYSRMELKADIMNGGVVCWKSRAGREGLPWDRRCWEIQPWFMRKWGWLVEERGRLEEQSRWWRGLRES